MSSLVSSHKIFVCENAGRCLASGYFLRPYFFTMPIILDILHIPRDFSFSFFVYEKLQIENSCLRMCSATCVTRGERGYGGLRDK